MPTLTLTPYLPSTFDDSSNQDLYALFLLLLIPCCSSICFFVFLIASAARRRRRPSVAATINDDHHEVAAPGSFVQVSAEETTPREVDDPFGRPYPTPGW